MEVLDCLGGKCSNFAVIKTLNGMRIQRVELDCSHGRLDVIPDGCLICVCSCFFYSDQILLCPNIQPLTDR